MGYCTQCDAEWFDGDPRKMCDCEELFNCNCCDEQLKDSEGQWYDGSFFCPDCLSEYLKEEEDTTGHLQPVISITNLFHFKF